MRFPEVSFFLQKLFQPCFYDEEECDLMLGDLGGKI